MAKLYAELLEISAELDKLQDERALAKTPAELQSLDYKEEYLRKTYRELMGL